VFNIKTISNFIESNSSRRLGASRRKWGSSFVDVEIRRSLGTGIRGIRRIQGEAVHAKTKQQTLFWKVRRATPFDQGRKLQQ
jgi:hypothetical protein